MYLLRNVWQDLAAQNITMNKVPTTNLCSEMHHHLLTMIHSTSQSHSYWSWGILRDHQSVQKGQPLYFTFSSLIIKSLPARVDGITFWSLLLIVKELCFTFLDIVCYCSKRVWMFHYQMLIFFFPTNYLKNIYFQNCEHHKNELSFNSVNSCMIITGFVCS